jgi:large subunit ribosomal protein L33
MAKKSTQSVVVGLVSVLTGYRIYTKKNKKNHPEPLEKMAYDKIAQKHAKFVETKKNLGRNEVKVRKG